MPTQALIMFAAGIGIPLLAALNARLGANIGSPAAAANYSKLETVRKDKRIEEIDLYRSGWRKLVAKELEKSRSNRL